MNKAYLKGKASGSLLFPTDSESIKSSLKTSYGRQFGKRARSSRAPLEERPPIALRPLPSKPHLTCGCRGGGSRVSPQGQHSDVQDKPPTCPKSRPAQCGACQVFAFSEPGLRGCQFSGTGVGMASFQKTWENQKGSGRDQTFRSPQVPFPGGQQSDVGAARAGCFRRPGGGLRSTRPEALTWDLSSFSSWLQGSELRSRPSSLCTNFSPAPSFPGGGGDTQCAARAPIGRTGRGRGVSSVLCAEGRGSELRGPSRPAWALSSLRSRPRPGWGRKDMAARLRLVCRVPPSARSLGSPGVLPGTLLATQRGLTLKPASLLPSCLLLRVGCFSHLPHVDRNTWALGREVNCSRTTPWSGRGQHGSFLWKR
ncbi:uncharacterized protein LOC132682340 [Panthera onca]